MNLGTSQRLEQTLSPQLLQSINILQKTSLELETAIKDELETNPLLELDDSMPDEDREVREDELSESGAERSGEMSSENDAYGDGDDRESGSLDDSAMIDRGLLDGVEGDVNYEQLFSDGTGSDDAPFKDLNAGSSDTDDEWDRPIKDNGKSLQEQLRDQLMLWSGNRDQLEELQKSGCSEKRFRSLVEYLIDSVNEDGFLQVGEQEHAPINISSDEFVNEIETMLRGEKPLEDCTLPVREALHVLQGFNPRGIGARDQRECFLIQAYSIPNFSPLAIRILETCYEDLLALRYAKIAKSLKESQETVQKAVASFAKLNPHPGFSLSNARVQTISADLRILEKRGKFSAEAVRSPMQKRLRINQTYKAIMDDKNASKSDRDYVKTHLNKAMEFMKAIDNRYSTMELVMLAILKRQKDFFAKGPAFLKPMVLQDIADDVKRDVSTVNRVTNGKYVDTPYGVYELKRFFTSGIRQKPAAGGSADAGAEEVLGSAQVLDAMKKMIDEENKKKPLSDQAISDKLAEMGMKVARRTVAKYRENSLKILPASQRKLVK
ncbi:MAG: RNA polymerase factor sigma-54 [Fibrobacter sp.]|nr:RNA polymerase factor sigma-54 [Fibrobacter sp.]